MKLPTGLWLTRFTDYCADESVSYAVSLRALQRVTLVPDPCTLLIDGVTVGLTSTDILFHMGAEEISW